MKIIREKCVYKGKYLKVVEKEFLTKNKTKGIWECAEGKSAVFIFPVTKNKEVILEKIYRVPVEDYLIELPAGLLDKENETTEGAAKRELLEETGHIASKLIFICDYYLAPARGSQQGSLFYAANVEFKGKKNTEDDEEIEVIKVPLKDLEKFLISQQKRGTKVDINLWGALALLKNRKLV